MHHRAHHLRLNLVISFYDSVLVLLHKVDFMAAEFCLNSVKTFSLSGELLLHLGLLNDFHLLFLNHPERVLLNCFFEAVAWCCLLNLHFDLAATWWLHTKVQNILIGKSVSISSGTKLKGLDINRWLLTISEGRVFGRCAQVDLNIRVRWESYIFDSPYLDN